MIYLVLSILASTLINVIFRVFNRYDIDNQQAITFNYLTCVLTGMLMLDFTLPWQSFDLNAPWFSLSLGLGSLFIVVFLGMAITARKDGISVSVVASKMGVIFPVLFAALVLEEHLSGLVVTGILISLLSVFLTSRKNLPLDAVTMTWIPVLVWLGSGAIDTLLKVIETHLPEGVTEDVPVIIIFFSAAVFGSAILTYRIHKRQTTFHLRHLLAGILLGIPNYFSIYFVFMALRSNVLSTAQVFPVNNLGVVLFSTLISVLVFREKLSKINLAGLLLALIAIILLSQTYAI